MRYEEMIRELRDLRDNIEEWRFDSCGTRFVMNDRRFMALREALKALETLPLDVKQFIGLKDENDQLRRYNKNLEAAVLRMHKALITGGLK